MAVRLPNVEDIAIPRADPSRPTGTFDATPIATGAEKIAQAGINYGNALQKVGQGLNQFGAGLGEFAQDQSRWQFTKARADFLSRQIDLDAAVGKSDNYGPDASGKTMPDRYTDQLNGIRAQSAGMIQDPRMRDLFITHTQTEFEAGVVRAEAHARSLSNEAQIGYVTQMGDKAINQAVAARNDDERSRLIDAHNDLIDGLAASGAISDAKAREMKQAWAHQYATADLLARADTDPQGVINELRAKPGSPDAITNRIISIEGQARNARSSAIGVGQFVDGTWLDMLKTHRPDLAAGRSDQELLALRSDKALARDMVTAYQQDNAKALKSAGLEATPGNLYLAHFLGPGGAKAVLQADPNAPVADALAKALGPDKAKAMVDANPTVLRGQLAGSVKAWADGKMGGSAGGEGTIYDMLRPDVRETVLAHAQTQLQKQATTDLAGFKSAIEDSQAEASRTGDVKTPLQLSDFIGHLGSDLGPKAYQNYSANIQVAKDAARVATMNPDEMAELIKTYEPKAGEGYAAAAERADLIRKAVTTSLKQRTDDPGGFAAGRLPGTGAAYKAYSTVMADPMSPPEARNIAARNFAAASLLEQGNAGIAPNNRQILPNADAERLSTAISQAAGADDPQARVKAIALIQAQAKQWGDYWPQVAAQLAPSMQPMARAIAAGADPEAMARLLRLDPKENVVQILKEQSETKASDLRKNLNTEMAELLSTMLPVQRDRDGDMYFRLAERLGALYVRDGKDAATAARDAVGQLIGNRYDIRDTFRIPKSQDYSPDDVQAGALVAKSKLAELGAKPAVDDIGGITRADADGLAKFRRDGTWVTSPRNDGLNLMYDSKAVRGADGAPLFLSWGQLAQMGGTPQARTEAARRQAEFSGPQP